MAITSSDIQNQSFSVDRRGYDVDEVDVFLEHVAQEVDELNATIEQLENELDGDKFSGFDTPGQVVEGDAELIANLEEKERQIAELEQQLEDKKADDNAIAQALIIAQRSADEIVANANAEADQINQDAEDEAQRILDKANSEKQKVLDEIEKLEDDREDTRTEYQDILKDFISHATKKLSDIGGAQPAASSHVKSSFGDRSIPKNQAPIRKDVSARTATYTTPQTSAASVVVPNTPKASRVEKDLSGFGDADDAFDTDDVD